MNNEFKTINDEIWHQVQNNEWSQLWGQIEFAQIYDRVLNQLWIKIWGKIRISVSDQVRIHIRNQILTN